MYYYDTVSYIPSPYQNILLPRKIPVISPKREDSI